MHGELRLLSRAGLASAEALAVAVDAFGVADRGRIAEVHFADLVLVPGDLEEDLPRSHDIVAIRRDGYLDGSRGGLQRGQTSGRGGACPCSNAGCGLRGRP